MSWFDINSVSENSAHINLRGIIGWEVNAGSFRWELERLGDVPELTVDIASDGGLVTQGLEIFTALRDHPAKVTTRVVSLAASMASVAFQAGDRRIITEIASLMIHSPSDEVHGTAADMRVMADQLDTMKSQVMAAYRSGGRLKISESELAAAMDRETWYTAQAAVDAGLADEVEAFSGSDTATALFSGFDLSNYQNVPDRVLFLINSKDSKSKRGISATKTLSDKTMSDDGKMYSEAELQAAVEAAVVAAKKEIGSETPPDVEGEVSAAVEALNSRYSALCEHPNASGANLSSVMKLARSSMPIEEAIDMLDDFATAMPEKKSKGEGVVSDEQLLAAARQGARAALLSFRKGTSDTSELSPNGGGDEGGEDSVVKDAIAAANERRNKGAA